MDRDNDRYYDKEYPVNNLRHFILNHVSCSIFMNIE